MKEAASGTGHCSSLATISTLTSAETKARIPTGSARSAKYRKSTLSSHKLLNGTSITPIKVTSPSLGACNRISTSRKTADSHFCAPPSGHPAAVFRHTSQPAAKSAADSTDSLQRSGQQVGPQEISGPSRSTPDSVIVPLSENRSASKIRPPSTKVPLLSSTAFPILLDSSQRRPPRASLPVLQSADAGDTDPSRTTWQQKNSDHRDSSFFLSLASSRPEQSAPPSLPVPRSSVDNNNHRPPTVPVPGRLDTDHPAVATTSYSALFDPYQPHVFGVAVTAAAVTAAAAASGGASHFVSEGKEDSVANDSFSVGSESDFANGLRNNLYRDGINRIDVSSYLCPKYESRYDKPTKSMFDDAASSDSSRGSALLRGLWRGNRPSRVDDMLPSHILTSNNPMSNFSSLSGTTQSLLQRHQQLREGFTAELGQSLLGHSLIPATSNFNNHTSSDLSQNHSLQQQWTSHNSNNSQQFINYPPVNPPVDSVEILENNRSSVHQYTALQRLHQQHNSSEIMWQRNSSSRSFFIGDHPKRFCGRVEEQTRPQIVDVWADNLGKKNCHHDDGRLNNILFFCRRRIWKNSGCS